jgi:hypothetical protein
MGTMTQGEVAGLEQLSGLRKSQLPPLDALVYSSMGLLVLLIGSWVPDDRLNVAGLPLDLIILIAGALIATTATIRRGTLHSVAIIQIPLVLLAITLLWSTDPDIGLDKLTTLIVSGSLGFVLLNTVIERHGVNQLALLLAVYLGLLLMVAIPYKLANGFFDRSVNFFINGPIIFGRLMCIAAVLALFFLRGKRRVVATTIFFLAVVWTESKGPILALVLTLFSVALIGATPQVRKRFLAFVTILLLGIAAVFAYFDLGPRDFGRLGVFYSVATADTTALEGYSKQGSLGARVEMWSKTVELIPQKPFGIGLGAWDRAVDTRLPTPYAHNLMLELWSEGGLMLGSFALIPFVIFFFGPKKIFWFVALCLFLAQMLSGDIGDARFLLVFGLLAFFSKRESSALGAAVFLRDGLARAPSPKAAM